MNTGPWSRLLDILCDLAKQKPWLREECGWVLYKALQNRPKDFEQAVYGQLTLEKLVSKGLAKTPEGIAIWIGAQARYSEMAFPSGVWSQQNPLHRHDRTIVRNILKESSTVETIQDPGMSKVLDRGSWNAKPHFAWDVVLSILCGEENSHRGSANLPTLLDFGEFWSEIVDGELLSCALLAPWLTIYRGPLPCQGFRRT